jgi:tetratricopeptide (TPR) repeat protein
VEGAALRRYHPRMLAAGTARGQASRLGGDPDRAASEASLVRTETAASLPLAEAAAALAAFVLYLPATGFGFVFDDEALIAEDGWPRPLGPLLPYRPLRYLSYLVDGWLGGSAAIYHFDNVLLHALVAALAAALARRLVGGGLAALVAGLFVAFHPLAVEAAAYVAGRRDLLCVAFGLASLLAHRAGHRALAMALLIASVGSKESGLVFAAPLVAMTLSGLAQSRPQRRPAANASAAGATFTTTSEHSTVAGDGATVAAALAVVGTSAALAGALAVAYGAVGPWWPPPSLAAAAFPGIVAAHYASGFLGLRAFAADYPSLSQSASALVGGDPTLLLLGTITTLGMAAAVALTLRACARDGRDGNRAASDRVRSFAAAWVAMVALALAVGGGLHEPGADRHAYLMLPALGLAAAVLLDRLRGATQGAVAGVAALALVGAALAGREQIEVWSSARALWTHAASQTAVSARTHANLARVLAGDGEYRAARRHLREALVAEPHLADLHLARAAVQCATGRRLRARRDLDRARILGASDAAAAGIAAACPHRARRAPEKAS